MDKLKSTDLELLCSIFEEYSKNSVFQLAEYGDVSKMHTKLKKIVEDMSLIDTLELSELVYLINMLQVTSTRHKTPIQNWRRILDVYETLITVAKEVDQKKKEDSKNMTIAEVPE